jgi:hypothetical protein
MHLIMGVALASTAAILPFGSAKVVAGRVTYVLCYCPRLAVALLKDRMNRVMEASGPQGITRRFALRVIWRWSFELTRRKRLCTARNNMEARHEFINCCLMAIVVLACRWCWRSRKGSPSCDEELRKERAAATSRRKTIGRTTRQERL